MSETADQCLQKLTHQEGDWMSIQWLSGPFPFLQDSGIFSQSIPQQSSAKSHITFSPYLPHSKDGHVRSGIGICLLCDHRIHHQCNIKVERMLYLLGTAIICILLNILHYLFPSKNCPSRRSRVGYIWNQILGVLSQINYPITY